MLDRFSSFSNKIELNKEMFKKKLLKLLNQIVAFSLKIFSDLNEVLILVRNFFRDIKIKD